MIGWRRQVAGVAQKMSYSLPWECRWVRSWKEGREVEVEYRVEV